MQGGSTAPLSTRPGGGIGPGHWGYADDAAEIWWDPSAREASANNPGAYRWTHGGLRFRLGQFPGDDSQLFRSGATDAPEG